MAVEYEMGPDDVWELVVASGSDTSADADMEDWYNQW
jgi:hypothetical protein